MSAELLALLEAVEELEREAKRSPVDHIAWLPPQIAFLSHDDPRPALLRLGNRQGKSTAGAAALIFACRGQHPFLGKLRKQPPVRCALVCMNMLQSVEIQRVLWELLGAEHNTELVPGTEWTARTGFRGHRPVVEWKNGSSITIYSNAQGAGTLAGAEYDIILLDEPPAQEVYDEALARIRNTGGQLLLTLTPINGPPLPWLRKLTEEGENGEPPKVVDYHYTLAPEHCISPLTGLVRRTKDGAPWDADFIAQLEATVDPITRDIRLHGAWERAYEGQYFACWDPKRHVTRHLPSSYDRFYLGFDYASSLREHGMCAVFIGTKAEDDGQGGKAHHIYIIDEVVMAGHDTMQMFASRVMKMLQTHGVKWTDLDGVYGDRPVRSRWGTSGNGEMTKQVARILRVPQRILKPRILSVKEGAGSSGKNRYVYDHRMQWQYQQIATDRVRVHPRCEHYCKAMLEFDGSSKHPLKDVNDAAAYAMFDLWKFDRSYGTLPKVMF